jgi:hypothetical protein
MEINKFKILICLCFIIKISVSNSQENNFYLLLNKAKNERKFSGIIGVYDIDSNKYNILESISLEKNLDTNSLFNIGSISKVITGIMIVNEIFKGSINLESKVADILSQSRYGDLKVKNLLTHISGFLRLESILNPKKIPKNVETNFKYLNLLYSDSKFRKPINESFIYSNHNYHLLSIILEKLNNSKYDIIAQNFFDSLKIQNAFFSYGFPKDTSILAPPLYLNKKLMNYRLDKTLRLFIEMDSTTGSGKVYMSMSNLVLLTKKLLNNKILCDSFLFYSPTNVATLKKGRTYLMESLTLPNNDILYYHGGNSYGYNCIYGYNKNKNKVYIVLSNLDSQLDDRKLYEELFKAIIYEY